jgi:hypothetical protein
MDDNQEISERQARLVASHDSLRVLLTKRAGLEATDVHGAIQKKISVSSIGKTRLSESLPSRFPTRLRNSTSWRPTLATPILSLPPNFAGAHLWPRSPRC